MKLIILFVSSLVAAGSAFANNDLISCADLLSRSLPRKIDNQRSVILKDRQILVRGTLTEFWETGMEDQTGWFIYNTFTFEKLSANKYHALHDIRPGDQVFLLDEQGQVRLTGYYGETSKPGVVNIAGRDIPVGPNRPMLYAEPELVTPIISEEELAKAFSQEASAVVLLTLTEERLARLWKLLEDDIAKYQKHILDPNRFLNFKNDSFEISHFEESSIVKAKVIDLPTTKIIFDEKLQKNLVLPAGNAPEYIYELGGNEFRLQYHDKLLLVDKENNLLDVIEGKNPRKINISPAKVHLSILVRIRKDAL